jgi:hypothetical protein
VRRRQKGMLRGRSVLDARASNEDVLGVSSRDIYGSVCIDVTVPELIGFDIGLLELFGIVVLLEVLLGI